MRSAAMPHVASSAVTDVDYDDADRRLIVRFRSGERYAYGATPALYRAFLEAPSKGRFFQARIRDRLPFEKL